MARNKAETEHGVKVGDIFRRSAMYEDFEVSKRRQQQMKVNVSEESR